MNSLNDTNGTPEQNGFHQSPSSATALVEAPDIALGDAVVALRRLTTGLRLRPTLALKERREMTWVQFPICA